MSTIVTTDASKDNFLFKSLIEQTQQPTSWIPQTAFYREPLKKRSTQKIPVPASPPCLCKDIKHPLLHGCHGTSQARCEKLRKKSGSESTWKVKGVSIGLKMLPRFAAHIMVWRYDFITCALCSQKAVASLPHCTRCQDHKSSPHPKAEKSSQHTDLQIEHTLPQSTMAMEEPIFWGEIQETPLKLIMVASPFQIWKLPESSSWKRNLPHGSSSQMGSNSRQGVES